MTAPSGAPESISLDAYARHRLELARLLSQPSGSDREDLVAEHWREHPRFQFFKSLPRNARLLDLGAGAGGLFYWRSWGEPRRDDIVICGVDREPGEFQNLYAESRIVDLERGEIDFPAASFDGMVLSHVLEHLDDLSSLRSCLPRIAKPGSRIYIETPTPRTLELIPRARLLASQVRSATFNFFDDITHIRPWSPDQLRELLVGLGATVEQAGIVEGPPDLIERLLAYGVYYEDEEITTYGLWRMVGWAAYAVGRFGTGS